MSVTEATTPNPPSFLTQFSPVADDIERDLPLRCLSPRIEVGRMFRAPVQTLVAAGALVACSSAFSVPLATAAPESPGSMPPVVANDNRRPAGRLEGDTLKLSLRAGRGSWQPEGPEGPRLSIEAFGEAGSALAVPAPLVRVEAGTVIDVTLRNDLDVTAAGARPVRPRWRCLSTAGSAAARHPPGAVPQSINPVRITTGPRRWGRPCPSGSWPAG